MAEGRQRDEWQRTSWIVCKIHNAACTKKSDMRMPSDFNPFEMQAKRKPMGGVDDLKKAFRAAYG